MMEYTIYEYLNNNLLIIIGIILAMTVLMDIFSKKISFGMYFLLTIMILGILYEANNRYKTTKINIQSFEKKDNVFKCYSGGSFSSPNVYKVSKNDVWEVDGKYFIKDSVMIRADKCEKIKLPNRKTD